MDCESEANLFVNYIFFPLAGMNKPFIWTVSNGIYTTINNMSNISIMKTQSDTRNQQDGDQED